MHQINHFRSSSHEINLTIFRARSLYFNSQLPHAHTFSQRDILSQRIPIYIPLCRLFSSFWQSEFASRDEIFVHPLTIDYI